MSNLKLVFIVLAASLIVSTSGMTNNDTIPYYLFNASSTFKIDMALLQAVCTVESRCKAKAVNKDDATASKRAKGVKEHSLGLFQIKLATARGLGFKGSRADLMKPEVNTWYAAKLLRSLYDRYHLTYKVVSAYNAGHYIKSNKAYVDKVFRQYVHFKVDAKPWKN